MRWISLMTVALLVSFIDAIDQFKESYSKILGAEDLCAECQDDVYCKMNDPELLMRLNIGGIYYEETDQKYFKDTTLYDKPVDKNSVEYWDRYAKIYCTFPLQKKQEFHRECIDEGYAYFVKVCADELSTECVNYNKYTLHYQALHMEVFAKGYCLGIAELLGITKEAAQAAAVAVQVANAATSALQNIAKSFG